MSNEEYRKWLISGILEFQTKTSYTREELEKKSTMLLDDIYDNVD